MGVREDVSAWIAYYIVKPAIDAFKKHATAIERAWATFIGVKLRIFLMWVGNLNTSVSAWVKNEIKEAIDAIEDDGGSWFWWIGDIVGAVLDAIYDVFVKVTEFTKKVADHISKWWPGVRDTLLRTVKDTFVSIVDFAADVTKIIVEFGYEAFSVIVKHVAGAINIAINAVTTVIDSVIKNVSSIMNTVADYLVPAISNIWDSITDLAVDVAGDIAGTVRDMRDLVTDSVLDMIEYIDDTIPEVVSSMFEWAKPIKDPIIKASADLEYITTALREKVPTDPEWRRVMDENTAILAEVKEKLKGEIWQ